MKPFLKFTIIAVLVLAVAGISAAGLAYAQGDDPIGRESLAELLGLTREELRDAIQGGKTIQELADEAGFDLDAYHEEMLQDREENLRARIEEALEEGLISQEQADWLLEGLDKGFLDGPFLGFGGRGEMGFGGRGATDGQKAPGIRGGCGNN